MEMIVRMAGIILLICSPFISCNQAEPDFPSNAVIPTPQQIQYQRMELIGFFHFTVNTFTDKEWGDGTESPSIFNPTKFDARQWVQVAKDAGMKLVILTAKHHDGFCLWPSTYTDHSVKSSPWRNGKGDVVRELADACREQGLKLGLYLSPWDRHEPSYGTDSYNDFYKHQLRELLTNYGEISEIWMDGAKGKNARDMEYDFVGYRKLIRELQPNALIFSDAGPDIRWIGNEHGIAGETNWSMINNEAIVIGKADRKYLNTGDPNGSNWLVGECDVSIRPGWFYHASQDDRVKVPEHLVDLYYKSVGRNGTLLLNLPPDTRGLIHENDIASLKEFRSILDETFAHNLGHNADIQSSSQWAESIQFSPENMLDEDLDSYWAAAPDQHEASIEIRWDKPVTFDRILLQEPIRFGQRIAGFTVDVNVAGKWQEIARATTIGHKRLLRVPTVIGKKVKINIVKANNVPAISNVGFFKASYRDIKPQLH